MSDYGGQDNPRAQTSTCSLGEAESQLAREAMLPLFRSAFPNGMVHEFDNAGLFSLEDHPDGVCI